MSKTDFDFNKALEQLQAGQGLTGKDGVLTPLIKQLTEAALKAELDQHLEQDESPNRKTVIQRRPLKPASVNLNWIPLVTDLHNRGVKDILIASIDGLTGFPEAIATIYPDTEVQLCVIHQIRNSLNYVASKNQKEFMRDLKPVYQAQTKQAAESALEALEAKWGAQYPLVVSSWQRKWENLSGYFKYPEYIRKVIYTTNAIEAVHRQFRKLTKTKGGFPNENSLLKLLYAGILNASKKWTMPVQNWNLALSQLAIHFEGRLDEVLDI